MKSTDLLQLVDNLQQASKIIGNPGKRFVFYTRESDAIPIRFNIASLSRVQNTNRFPELPMVKSTICIEYVAFLAVSLMLSYMFYVTCFMLQ